MKTSISQEVAKTVIETWKSEDGTSWYRKWSDGWIEQGGGPITAGKTITMPLNFLDLTYSIVASTLTDSTGSVQYRYIAVKSRTISSFVFGVSGAGSGMWYACGY